MQVRILTSIAGHADPERGLPQSFSFAPGQAVELPDALAEKWMASGVAAALAPKAIKDQKKR